MSERLTEKGVARLGAVPVLGLVPGLCWVWCWVWRWVGSFGGRLRGPTRATQHLQVHLKSRGHPAGRRRLPKLLHVRLRGCPRTCRGDVTDWRDLAHRTATDPEQAPTTRSRLGCADRAAPLPHSHAPYRAMITDARAGTEPATA